MTIRDRIVAWLRENPEACSKEIAEAVGISREHASVALIKALRAGSVRRRLNTDKRYVYAAAEEAAA